VPLPSFHHFPTPSPNSNLVYTVRSFSHSPTTRAIQTPFQNTCLNEAPHQTSHTGASSPPHRVCLSLHNYPQTNGHHVADIHHVRPPVQADLHVLASGPPDLTRTEPAAVNSRGFHQQYSVVFAQRETLHGQRPQRVVPSTAVTTAVGVELAVGFSLGSSPQLSLACHDPRKWKRDVFRLGGRMAGIDLD
jgi:hypothetical protein